MNKLKSAAVLRALVEPMKRQHLRVLFESDPQRFDRYSLRLDDLLLDYSKNNINQDVFQALMALADEAGVRQQRDRLFAGEAINHTEGRAVLHPALRAPTEAAFCVDGRCIMTDIHRVLQAMGLFSEGVRSGRIRGCMGRAFTDVVSIGIGGSDLGPAMAVRALAPYHDGPRCHFVANVDGADLGDLLLRLDPETTLFLVVSKTFTTQETMTNACSARAWIVDVLGAAALQDHFVAISTNREKAIDFGLSPERIFGFWDWVGGRYSVWSAVGLSLMMAIGERSFAAFLAGAHAMDRHFVEAPLHENMPVIMALIGIWYRSFLNYPAYAVLPYDQRLARFPAYLQQLDMESNGKSVDSAGATVSYPTGPIVFGEAGTNGQHAFYQLIHQGNTIIPCDFLLAANPTHASDAHHLVLSANCFAQAEALMRGKTEAEVRTELAARGGASETIERLVPHRVFGGNRPSNMLLYRQLDPAMLGRLIALYEHKIFVQGVVFDVNSFDQWGVELGKELATLLLPMLVDRQQLTEKDASTSGLVHTYHAMRS